MTESSPRPAAPYGDFQLEIYLAGLGGTVPTPPVSLAELKARAAPALPPSVLSYAAGGRELAASLVPRAERAGFRAIVVTLGTWITGWRPRDLSASNFPQLRGLCLANYTSGPVFRARLCHPDDARRALDAGADGIYVSNHGGRQANGGLPALDCLPGVVEAAAVFLAGNAVGSATPTPGGLGAVEAVLAAGLTAIGIPAGPGDPRGAHR